MWLPLGRRTHPQLSSSLVSLLCKPCDQPGTNKPLSKHLSVHLSLQHALPVVQSAWYQQAPEPVSVTLPVLYAIEAV